jgi:hypothetical protein
MHIRFSVSFWTENPAAVSKAYLHLSIHSSIKQKRQPNLVAFCQSLPKFLFRHGKFQCILPFWEWDVERRLE